MLFTIEELLTIAKEKKASDVHVTVGLPPRIRINGELVDLDYPKMTPADCEELILSIMDERQKELFKDRGELDFSFSSPNIGRYRVNVFRQRGSVACAMRVVGTVIPKPESLGVPKSVIELYAKKRGLVLVTGPTGSGKSTTLASLIDRINDNRNAHVITLEDPIEYRHTCQRCLIQQREVGVHCRSFAAGLRAALREDPDVILLGELRDSETIRLALTAAETGHLVLATLHTRGAAQAVERLVDSFPAQEKDPVRSQLAGSLRAVLSQKLETDRQDGRVALFELLINTPAVGNLIREGKIHQLPGVIQTSQQAGMQTFAQSLQQRQAQGRL